MRGLDPTLKASRLANYVLTLRKEILRLCRACGVAHPALISYDHFEILDEGFVAKTINEIFDYQKTWGLPSGDQQQKIRSLMDQ